MVSMQFYYLLSRGAFTQLVRAFTFGLLIFTYALALRSRGLCFTVLSFFNQHFLFRGDLYNMISRLFRQNRIPPDLLKSSCFPEGKGCRRCDLIRQRRPTSNRAILSLGCVCNVAMPTVEIMRRKQALGR
ncbi:hypothetical protein B0T26DRAFT_165309 [Lasiosphaeria miniovina]|uniref:Uncharacterized protein n=1 Tax=Lasiosphaeria miniovina TaxID=1954250 RepID=A0AA40B5U5_9PEZI|nr:uncharacterized protein B0T26DRAFT_165309 [Lasiosphaeria miniovina]KAK0728251.1 hypothetical protein B0T26DRAFT_165309 [Lasiosphaeria miniovina]